jgi:transposase InsO family protein
LATISDHADPIAANLLDRQSTAAASNQRWVGDTTEFVTGDSQNALRNRRSGSVLTLRGGLGGQRRQ